MSKENNNNSSHGHGLGFTGALTIAFIVLKLCGVISWSWLWVLAPIWINFAIVLVTLGIAGLAALVVNR